MWSFIAGLISGVALVITAIVAVFFRAGQVPIQRRPRSSQSATQQRSRRASALKQQYAGPVSDIPEYLRLYNEGVDTETCAWMAIVVHRLFRDFIRQSASLGVDFEGLANEKLAALDIPEFVGKVVCQELDLGDIVPLVQSVKIISWRQLSEPLVMECHVTYRGNAHVSIETQVQLNVAGKHIATLPIEVALSSFEFDGVLLLTITPTVDELRVGVSLNDEPFLDFDIHSEFGTGSQHQLRDVPHLKTMLVTIVTRELCDKMLVPSQVETKVEGYDIHKLLRKSNQSSSRSGKGLVSRARAAASRATSAVADAVGIGSGADGEPPRRASEIEVKDAQHRGAAHRTVSESTPDARNGGGVVEETKKHQ